MLADPYRIHSDSLTGISKKELPLFHRCKNTEPWAFWNLYLQKGLAVPHNHVLGDGARAPVVVRQLEGNITPEHAVAGYRLWSKE